MNPTDAGKRCIVLGGSGALGSAVCQALAARGCRVAFTYLTREGPPPTPGAIARRLDLRSVPDLERVVDELAAELGGVDAFVQCAGVGVTIECAGTDSHHRLPHIDEKAWDWMIDVNVKGTFFAVRRLIGFMRERGGNIVLTGSIDGVKPAPSPVHYAASKGALQGMTMSMAKELGEFNVRVNLVAPGVMDGGLSRTLPKNLLDEYKKHCGLRRLGRLQEIAGLMAWLATENTYVTGQTIVVDGGL